MARGYPDHFGQPQFPRYGGAIRVASIGNIAGGESEVLHNISAKGQIYGGYVRAYGIGSHESDYVTVTIDGNVLTDRAFDNLLQHNTTSDKQDITYLSRYDIFADDFTLHISNGIIFESSFIVEYKNEDSMAMTYESALYYFSIE